MHGSALSLRHRDDEENGDISTSLHLDHRRSLPSNLLSSTVEEGPDQSGGGYFTSSHGQEDGARLPSIYRTPASPSSAADSSGEVLYTPTTRPQRVWGITKQVFHTLFPTLHHFRGQSVLGKIASLVAAPAVMLLTLTLPVVVMRYDNSGRAYEKPIVGAEAAQQLIDFEEEGIERVLVAEEEVQENMHELTFNKWLMAVQCLLGPLFCAGVLFSKYYSGSPVGIT